MDFFSPFLQFAQGALKTIATWSREQSHVNSTNPSFAKRIVMVTNTTFYLKKYFGWFYLGYSFPPFELLYQLNFMCRFCSAFGFSFLFFLWKGCPKELQKKGKKSSFYVWASLHALSHLSNSAIPSSKPEWISCSLLYARLLCYLYYKSVKQTNKGTKGADQWGYTHEGWSQQPNQGQSPVIKDKKTFKGREARLQHSHWAFPARTQYREQGTASSLRACKEKGQWAVKLAAQQDIAAVLTQHNNKFNFIKVS